MGDAKINFAASEKRSPPRFPGNIVFPDMPTGKQGQHAPCFGAGVLFTAPAIVA